MFARICGLELGAVDRSAGRPRHRRHRADVIEVGVGDEDRFDGLDLQAVEGGKEPVRFVTWIDDQRVRGVLLAHDEAVLLHGPDREHAGVDHLPATCCFFRWRRRYMVISK